MYPINDASIGKKLEALPSPTLSPLFLTHGSNLEKDGVLLLLIKDGVTAVGLKLGLGGRRTRQAHYEVAFIVILISSVCGYWKSKCTVEREGKEFPC